MILNPERIKEIRREKNCSVFQAKYIATKEELFKQLDRAEDFNDLEFVLRELIEVVLLEIK